MRPFKRFTVLTTAGTGYLVAHPELVRQSPDGETVLVMTATTTALMDVDAIAEIVDKAKKQVKRND